MGVFRPLVVDVNGMYIMIKGQYETLCGISKQAKKQRLSTT